jgi:hypothetical protein
MSSDAAAASLNASGIIVVGMADIVPCISTGDDTYDGDPRAVVLTVLPNAVNSVSAAILSSSVVEDDDDSKSNSSFVDDDDDEEDDDNNGNDDDVVDSSILSVADEIVAADSVTAFDGSAAADFFTIRRFFNGKCTSSVFC